MRLRFQFLCYIKRKIKTEIHLLYGDIGKDIGPKLNNKEMMSNYFTKILRTDYILIMPMILIIGKTKFKTFSSLVDPHH